MVKRGVLDVCFWEVENTPTFEDFPVKNLLSGEEEDLCVGCPARAAPTGGVYRLRPGLPMVG
jgi:hypothetical protein